MLILDILFIIDLSILTFSLCTHFDAAVRLHGAEEDVPLRSNGRIVSNFGGKVFRMEVSENSEYAGGNH
jgi:hypothetical protein